MALEYQIAANKFKVWAYTTIEEDVEIGVGSVIGSCVYIGRGSRIGNNVRIQHGAFICRNAVIGDRSFIGPGAQLIDDPHPRAGEGYTPQPPVLGWNTSIGAGAIIMPGVTIESHAVVGAGAVVTRTVAMGQTVTGVPASFHIGKKNKADDADENQDEDTDICHKIPGYSVSMKIRKDK